MYLVEHADEIVSIETLSTAVWPGRSAEPAYVRKAIHEIRAALGDEQGELVKTTPRIGYLVEKRSLERSEKTARRSSTSRKRLVVGRLASDDYERIARQLRKPRKPSA